MPCSHRHRSCSPAHQQCVDNYRAARHAAELAREFATCNYRAELAEYGRIITFKEWLIGMREFGQDRGMVA